MSDVADLSLEQLKNKVVSLERENRAAFATIDRLLKDLNTKREEIDHLTSLVSQTVPVVQPKASPVADVAPEESIAEIQLAKLREISNKRTLTLEEVRTFDLLVKNKRLTQEKSTQNFSKGSFRDVSEVELIKIAQSKSNEPTEN